MGEGIRSKPWWRRGALLRGIPSHYSVRTRMRMALQFSPVGTAWEVFQTLFAVLVSALYVVETYRPELSTSMFDAVALGVFGVDYALNLYCSESRLRFMFSFMGLMDAVSLFPSMADQLREGEHKQSSLPFIRFVRVLRLLRLLRLVRAAGSRSVSAVQKQIYTIMLLITCIVFITAGIFHAVENGDTRPELKFGDALYYVVVTIATVGYGDITPRTAGGKAVAVAMILISFTVIPRELSRLNQLIAMQSQFRKTYQPAIGNPHILVVGHVTDSRCLLNFFREFYHPDRVFNGESGVRSPRQSPCVIMGPDEPTEEIINLLDHPVLQHRVTYIKGSVMSEEDLCRVGADSARACFILVSKLAADRQSADAEAILRLLAVRNYNPDLEIFSQIVSPTYLSYISDASTDHLLCLKQLKIALMAKSCLYPGLTTLICNMCRSSAVSKREGLAGGWQQEYLEGMSLEVYATTLPREFNGFTFSQSAELLYKCTRGEVILLGAYEGSHPKETRVAKADSPSRLPTVRVRPKLLRRDEVDMADGVTASEEVAVDRMLSNPGDSLVMREWHVVYVLSDNKKLTLESTLSSRLKEWIDAGNIIPAPRSAKTASESHDGNRNDTDESHGDEESDRDTADFAQDDELRRASAVELSLNETLDVLAIEAREAASATSDRTLTSPRPDRTDDQRHQRQVVIEGAAHPVSGEELRDHVIVVSDLDEPSLVAFVTVLRLKHHTAAVFSSRKREESHRKRRHWPILFLSWSSPSGTVAISNALQRFDDVFVMLATADSKSELLRANLLRARHCVLLADNSAVQNIDGGIVDSRIILHYLAVMAIQAEAISAAPLGAAIAPPGSRDSSFSSSSSMTPPVSSTPTNGARTRLPHGVAIRPIVELSIARTMHILNTELRKRVLAAMPSRAGGLQRRLSPSADASLVRATSFGYTQGHQLQQQHAPDFRRQNSRDLVKSGVTSRQSGIVRQSLYNLDQSLKSRKQTQDRMSSIRRDQESSQRHHFDYRGSTALPFYAAGYGFTDDIFDNMLCQSYFTPGLVRFVRELLFSENGRPSGHHNSLSSLSYNIDDQDAGSDDTPAVSSLIQVPVPLCFVTRTFGEFFIDLVANGNVIAIGLYRKAASASHLPYVVAGPKMEAVLQADDLVFALAPPGAWKRYSAGLSTKTTKLAHAPVPFIHYHLKKIGLQQQQQQQQHQVHHCVDVSRVEEEEATDLQISRKG